MKKKKIIGYGAGGRASILVDIIEDNNNFNIIGLVDKDLSKKKKLGYPIIGNDSCLKEIYVKKCKSIFLALASIKNISSNINLYNKIKKIGFRIENIISKKAIISKRVKFGEGVQVSAGVLINPNVKIGNNVILNAGCIIEHNCTVDDHCQIASGAFLAGGVKVGKGSFIGLGARINQEITIGSGCMVGSGSIVIKNVKKNKTVVGIPAKEVRKRK